MASVKEIPCRFVHFCCFYVKKVKSSLFASHMCPLGSSDLSRVFSDYNNVDGSLQYVHSESKNLCHFTSVHNFDKYWPIFKILSLLYSSRNLQQNPCHVAHHTLDMSLHYLAKLKIIQPLSVTAFTNST